jgi:CRP-like cAMP-binding protein
MPDRLLKFLSNRIPLSEQSIQLVEALHTQKTIPRKEHLLHEGEVCRHTYFIAKGCLRIYRLDDQLKEHTFKFGVEDWWINDHESFHTGQPAHFNIQAVEDTDVISFSKENFYRLCKEVPGLQQMADSLQARSFDASQRRIYMQISQTPDEKYLYFVNTYPDIFNRVPLHMIASYLGISRETLTRVRTKYQKK